MASATSHVTAVVVVRSEVLVADVNDFTKKFLKHVKAGLALHTVGFQFDFAVFFVNGYDDLCLFMISPQLYVLPRCFESLPTWLRSEAARRPILSASARIFSMAWIPMPLACGVDLLM